jgi:hypothetical protein
MKELSLAEMKQLEVPAPLTKAQKLERFATLIDGARLVLGLYHRLEFASQETKDDMSVLGSRTAFDVAAQDQTFKEAGIGHTVGSVQRFFELSNEELHAFSCDCGGRLTNVDQSRLIRDIARTA